MSDAMRPIIVQLIISLQKPQHTVPKSAFWQHSAIVAGLRKTNRGDSEAVVRVVSW
jgi:hypothetical protein